MFTPDQDGIYSSVWPTGGRRGLALGAYYALGIIVIWLAFAASLGLVATLVLLCFGAAVIFLAERMRQCTKVGVAVTVRGVEDTSGKMIAGWDEMHAVVRGTFAFKPSNGFTLVLDHKAKRSWAPGLWWRLGRRIGVGGVLPGPPTRTMAEQIAILLPQHKADAPTAPE